jgi:hypothetical protein
VFRAHVCVSVRGGGGEGEGKREGGRECECESVCVFVWGGWGRWGKGDGDLVHVLALIPQNAGESCVRIAILSACVQHVTWPTL